MHPEISCDLLVIGSGSGAGGLSSAVIAAHRGLKVIIGEGHPVRRHHCPVGRLDVGAT